jgi:diacylglycerol O-acyltransferase / wax synthase
MPVLRRRLFVPRRFQGRPLWVDDETFQIADHVREVALGPSAGDAELLEAAERLMGVLLDRSRPIWELWFITGVSGGRVGLLVKLHHTIADGHAAVAIMSSLFDLGPATPDPAPSGGPASLRRGLGPCSSTTRRRGSARCGGR